MEDKNEKGGVDSGLHAKESYDHSGLLLAVGSVYFRYNIYWSATLRWSPQISFACIGWILAYIFTFLGLSIFVQTPM